MFVYSAQFIPLLSLLSFHPPIFFVPPTPTPTPGYLLFIPICSSHMYMYVTTHSYSLTYSLTSEYGQVV